MSELDALLDVLGTLHPRKIDLSLGRIERLLDRLDRPQDRLPPVIHVAGTNGKGSTIAFLRAALEAAGYSAHVYTSPHLVRFNERIRLGRKGAGRLAEDSSLIAALNEVLRANGDHPITFFEVTTAAALHLYATHPADFCLLEVGLGGRFDATNVIARPLVAVIASISKDHAEFLGSDLAQIAAEKAGVLKRGVPGVVAPQNEHALAMIELEARAAGAPLYRNGVEYMAFVERGRLVYQDDYGLLDLPLPKLVGAHQIENAGLAVATLRRSAIPLTAAALEAGLLGADWPARMQRLKSGPLVELAPEGSDVWLDGGHNPHAGRALAEAASRIVDRDPRPLTLVTGMFARKDAEGFFRPFAEMRPRLIVTTFDSPTAAGTDELVDAALKAGLEPETAANVRDGVARALEAEGPAPHVLICGGLHFAGEVLAMSPETWPS